MSVLIKADAAADLAQPVAAPASPHDDLVRTLRQRIFELEQLVEDRDAALRETGPEHERAFAAGEAQGRQAGLAEADDLQQERLARLESGMAAATAAFEDQLRATDRLAAALAHDCLDILFGAAGERAKLVGDLIARQIKELEGAALIAIEVSREDFPDAASLEAMRRQAGDGVEIAASVELASGACAMKLRLGRIEIGIDRQWSVLAATLRDFAEADGA